MEHLGFGPVRIYLGDKSGKYPDGNQVIVQGRDTRVAFDTPLVSRHIGDDLDQVDLLILGHVHEDHAVSQGRLTGARVQVHQADLAAAQSWDGLARHYGYPAPVLATVRAMIERDFSWAPRPDATGYADGALWELGGGVRAAYLGRQAHGHVDQHMGGARGRFLGQHRRHQLALAVQVQRAFHPDQDVIGRAQAHRAAPDDTAARAVHHAADLRHIQRHRRQRFHGVGRARG